MSSLRFLFSKYIIVSLYANTVNIKSYVNIKKNIWFGKMQTNYFDDILLLFFLLIVFRA